MQKLLVMKIHRMYPVLFLHIITLSLLLSIACSRPADPTEATGNLVPNTQLAATPELLELGRRTFEGNCAICHGTTGEGNGPAAERLSPRPRDFVAARYRLVSTWESVPTDEDLFKTISRGIPGSSMPPWAYMSEKTRWALIHYVKAFTKKPFDLGPDHQPASMDDLPTGHLKVPPEPALTPESIAHGKELFKENCANCHGPEGLGNGPQKLETSEGLPTRARNLTSGLFKGGSTITDVYTRVMAGLPGTPMPSNEFLYGENAWDLVHFVYSLSTNEQRAQMEVNQSQIVVARAENLPSTASDPKWNSAVAVELPLVSVMSSVQHPGLIKVRALHDGEQIAFQLTLSQTARGNATNRLRELNTFPKFIFPVLFQKTNSSESMQAAVEKPVDIWMWRAESTSNLFVEDLIVDGLQDLLSSASSSKSGKTSIAYEGDTMHLTFRRALDGNGNVGAKLQAGSEHPVAFAIKDDSGAEDNMINSQSVTIWQNLVIAP